MALLQMPHIFHSLASVLGTAIHTVTKRKAIATGGDGPKEPKERGGDAGLCVWRCGVRCTAQATQTHRTSKQHREEVHRKGGVFAWGKGFNTDLYQIAGLLGTLQQPSTQTCAHPGAQHQGRRSRA